MSEKIYTILDLAEEFGKDKQSIRRRIARLRLQSLNKDTRKYSNDPLEYNYETYLELAKDFGVSKSSTSDTHNNAPNDTLKYDENLSKDKLIEVLERELKHSKEKLEKSIEEKDLDNDGIPDRIDIDDNRNEVQDVSDLSLVGNRTSKSSKKDKEIKEDKENQIEERQRENISISRR